MKMSAAVMRPLLIVGFLAVAPSLLAQSKPASQWPATPFKPNPKLTAQEKRGEHWFLQRCSICHLASFTKADAAGYPNKAPSLEGLLKGASPDKERAVREQIRNGSTNMPGFQYGLDQKDLDELIAYLKTL
jgi:mono/diheme cytochrome c family protein